MSCFDDSKVDRITLEGMLPAVMFGPEMEYLKNTTKDAARASVSNTWQIPYESDSEDSDGNTQLHNPNGIANNELQSYCMGLKNCHPATLGFFPGLGKTPLCWCPCDKALGGWRAKYKLPEPYRENKPNPCKNGRMTASALLAHLESIGERCVYHRATLNYINKLMCKDDGEYLGLKGGHYVFHKLNSDEYKKAYDNELLFLEVKSDFEKERARENMLKEQKSACDASADVSSITTASVMSGAARRKKNKSMRQKKSRDIKKNLAKEDKYKNILVIGVEYENKFSEEVANRLDSNDDRHDYEYTGKNNKTLTCHSKIVREAIRGYYVNSVLKDVSVSSIGWSGLGLKQWLHKIIPKPVLTGTGKDKSVSGYDAIFLDYYNVSENNWIDTFNNKTELMERIHKLIEDNQCDVIVPFSKNILENLHSYLVMEDFEVNFLTDKNIARHNHPLYYVDECDDTLRTLKKYNFTIDQGAISFGELTKASVISTWDCEDVEVDDMEYFDKVGDDETLLFVVLRHSAEGNTYEDEDKVATNNNKEKVNVYSLCVPTCFQLYIPLSLFSNHLKNINIHLKKHKSTVTRPQGQCPSFSMLSAMKDGFSVVLYSRTHLLLPKIIHKSQGLRLILADGMHLLFNGYLIHSGGCSRSGPQGNLLNDKRLFSYVWTKSRKSQREDATHVYRTHAPLCYSHEHKPSNVPCGECKKGIGTTIDLSNLDLSQLSDGDKICGNLDFLGWVVVKGPPIGKKLGQSINTICSSGVWTGINDHCASMKFSHNSLNSNFTKWQTDDDVNFYFHLLKFNVLDNFLPSKKYVIGYRNILSNFSVSQYDQVPHCDYEVPKRCVN